MYMQTMCIKYALKLILFHWLCKGDRVLWKKNIHVWIYLNYHLNVHLHKATCTIWKEIGKHIMLNLWFTLVSARMCCNALKLSVHFWSSQFCIHTISFLYLKPIHMPKKPTFSGVYMYISSHWHAHVKSTQGTVSATEWKMNFQTDRFLCTIIPKGFEINVQRYGALHFIPCFTRTSCYANSQPLLKRVKPWFFNVRINFE